MCTSPPCPEQDPATGWGRRCGAGCEQEAASCLPTSSLSPSQPRCGSPEPPASAESSAVAGGVFITPAGRLCLSHLGAACRCAASPPALVQGWQQSCGAGALVFWVLLGFCNSYIMQRGPAKPLPLRVCRGRKLHPALRKEPGCGGLSPRTPPPARAAGCPHHQTGQRGCSKPEPFLQS